MNCIFCNTELYTDESYVTDGKICVCNMCASRHTLYETAVFVANHSMESNIIRHDSDVLTVDIDAGLPDDGLTSQTDEEPQLPQGYIPDCPFHPCDTCHFYYGELDSCMVGEYEYTPTEEEYQKLVAAYGEEGAKAFFAPLTVVSKPDDGLTSQTDTQA